MDLDDLNSTELRSVEEAAVDSFASVQNPQFHAGASKWRTEGVRLICVLSNVKV